MDAPHRNRTSGPAGAEGNLADLAAGAAARHPEHPALVDAADPVGHTLSWGEVDAIVSAEAQRLIERGVGVGDRVVVRSAGGPVLAVAVLGALRAGAVAVPVGPGGTGGGRVGDVDAVVADCSPRLLVDAEPDAGSDHGMTGIPVVGPPDFTSRAEPVASRGGGEDLALLLYSSATPRGVCLSHRAVLANRAQAAALRPAPVTPADRSMLVQPLFHAYGLAAGLLQVCWAGATAVLPGPGRPDAAWLLEALVRHRVSGLAAGPSTYRALLDQPPDLLRAALAGVRVCTCGGAPLPPSWSAAFRAVTGHRIVEGYGLTEAGPVVTSTPLDGAPAPGSVGRVLPGIELRFVDRDGSPLDPQPAPRDPAPSAPTDVRAVAGRVATEVRAAAGRSVTDVRAAAERAATEVRAALRAAGPAGDPVGDMIEDAQDVEGPADPAGDAGLIVLRGPNLFSGYWPDRFGGPDPDGWFRTPDLGFVDSSGELHLIDRSPDLVVVNGFTVYPQEVERVLVELDGVADAAVVGVPDEQTVQAVRAVIVRTPDGEGLDADAVQVHCRAQLARFKTPTQVVFVDALPRTPSGRVARHLLARER